MTTLRESLNYLPNELAFGTSGLRGLVTDMSDLECYINARGFLRFLAAEQSLESGSKIYLAGDLRESTPRIMQAVTQAVKDEGHIPENYGFIPTPTISLYGFANKIPSIMVTGSHIPADRNGIKFIKADDEVLKEDEPLIKSAVATVRNEVYSGDSESALFDARGQLKEAVVLSTALNDAADLYEKRYTDIFDEKTLAGGKIIFYQHSAVGRDFLVTILRKLGAEVVTVGRSEVFIPIDSENVTDDDEAYFKKLAHEHPDAFAIVSTDGDSDRPFVVDEKGDFHRGDVLGVVVAEWLKAEFAGFPISASDAVDSYLSDKGVSWKHTRIGSPYVIQAMKDALSSGKKRVVGWEVNGGFMLGADLEVNGKMLRALPTRDAFIAILVALVAAKESDRNVSEIFAELPQRFSQAGLIDNFPVMVSKEILRRFSLDTPVTRREIEQYFKAENGFGRVTSLNTLDGIRIFFDNGDIAHLRPSGNAPQFRIYSAANSQQRADEIANLALREPDGIFRQMQRSMDHI
jgi:phosphomannomutase